MSEEVKTVETIQRFINQKANERLNEDMKNLRFLMERITARDFLDFMNCLNEHQLTYNMNALLSRSLGDRIEDLVRRKFLNSYVEQVTDEFLRQVNEKISD